ncbi:gamma-butyrobetaine dioxygenase-like [Sipha flava]|uniref:Gamma-butyrobetaine dioxygenase-like n=1 Tax=Sipha flava TaxID=143950 RepID=A0A8B8G4D3_9HEMI|nr:gamma-butyrobetaine dioxygenase-like [Sipha flava]
MDGSRPRWTAVAVTPSAGGEEIRLDDGCGGGGRYPYAWLRNNCRCSSCASGETGFRKQVIRDFQFRPVPDRFEIISDDVLYVKWDDSHVSTYDLQWLLERNFNEGQERREYQQIKWTAESFSTMLRSFKYENVIKSDEVLLQWLETLAIYGISIIKSCGLEHDRIKELAARVAFLKRTHYGKTFRVEAKDDATNLAYRSTYLQLHTDLPYYEYTPGVILLHCIIQPESSGGENEVTDGLFVCERLKEINPNRYKALSTIPVRWIDHGHDNGYNFHNIHHAPVICEDGHGRVKRINFSEPHRDSTFPVSIDDVRIWYDAIEQFVKIAYDENIISTFKMKPGDILTFDNHRVLHGRKGYQGSRLLIGGYLDWDLIKSRTRVLKSQLSK